MTDFESMMSDHFKKIQFANFYSTMRQCTCTLVKKHNENEKKTGMYNGR
jgi:hypothetical protein